MTRKRRRYSEFVSDFVIPLVVVVAILTIVFFAVSCSKPPAQGTIIDRAFEPGHMEGAFKQRYAGEQCTTSRDAKGNTSRSCSSKYDTYYEPNDHWVPDAWQFKLRDCKAGTSDCNEGWVTVDSETYSRYSLGQHYPDAR